MRWLAIVGLVACTTSHTLRVRTVDGLTGQVRPGEYLTVKTGLQATACEHYSRERGSYFDYETDNAYTVTDKDGWATIDIIESRGRCDLRPDGVEVYVHRSGWPIDRTATGPVIIPVFDHALTLVSGERTYITSRARDAFTQPSAATSVYEERFTRVDGERPKAFQHGDRVLVGSIPQDHPDRDGDDPFIRVALATVTPAGAAWRVELAALELSPTEPTYVVPPGFENQRDQLAAWGTAMLDETILRAATAAKLIDRDYLATSRWTIATTVTNPGFTSEIQYDADPYDQQPPQQRFVVRGTLVHRDGRILVENLRATR